jgi:WYL_2, Sm-like SH3 beta-barrel fold
MVTDREEMVKLLKRGAVDITFTKVDGSLRTMRATLNPSRMPPQMKNEDLEAAETHRKENPDVLPVWSIDDLGWRSFRLENILSAQYIEGYE